MNLQSYMNSLVHNSLIKMSECGYSVTDQEMVRDEIVKFLTYIVDNGLEEEFSNYYDTIFAKLTKKIQNNKSVSNLINTFSFYDKMSPAAVFIMSCVKRRVQCTLGKFLESSASYYEMACNSKGVQELDVRAALEKDGFIVDESVDLTTPTTIIAFSTELSLKTLYSISNYSKIVDQLYQQVTVEENGLFPNSGLLSNELGLINAVSGDWRNIGRGDTGRYIGVMNSVRDSYGSNIPVNFPDNENRRGAVSHDVVPNVSVNGHTLYKVFSMLPEEYQTMIKYQVVTAFSREDIKSLDQKVVSAIDYFLMIVDLNVNINSVATTNSMVVNSNNFDKMRYLINQLGSDELLFSMAYASASYIIAKSEIEGISFSEVKDSNYTNYLPNYNQQLHILVESDEQKKNLLNTIVMNPIYLKAAKSLNSFDLYTLVDKFSINELDWMFNSCNDPSIIHGSFEEMLHYCIFFKRHINNYQFIYDEEKYANINKLFAIIKNSNNLALLGSQITEWFTQINIYSLSEEEIDVLRLFDNEYFVSGLNYRDKVLYEKCREANIPFRMYYTLPIYNHELQRVLQSRSYNDEYEEIPFNSLASYAMNHFIVSSDKAFFEKYDGSQILSRLEETFGSYDKIPNLLKLLPIEHINELIVYCDKNEISLEDISNKQIGRFGVVCKATYLRNRIIAQQPAYADGDHIPFMGKLIDKGVDVLSASTLSRIYSHEQVQELIKQFEDNNIPMDLLMESQVGVITSNEQTLKNSQVDSYIDRRNLYLRLGCSLNLIPTYYYRNISSSNEEVEEVINILKNYYDINSIPRALFFAKPDALRYLLNRLVDEKINLYDFLNYVGVNSAGVVESVDKYIYVYNQVKNVQMNSAMVLVSFDELVMNNNSFNNKQSSEYLFDFGPYMLYATGLKIRDVADLCKNSMCPFYPELLYFDYNFLVNYLAIVIPTINGMKRCGVEFKYEHAYNFMNSLSYAPQNYYNQEDVFANNPRKVA